mmetsp:Transcript_28127/g.94742  ORF Transcript_28127/g.94742 Transcript_28127/m.94742 type:complete len:268 (-) Transcript_28127:86-889(-)
MHADELVEHGLQVGRGVEGGAALCVVLLPDGPHDQLDGQTLRRKLHDAHGAVHVGKRAQHGGGLSKADAVAREAVDLLRVRRRVERQKRRDDLDGEGLERAHDVRVRRRGAPRLDHGRLIRAREEFQDGGLDARPLVNVRLEADAGEPLRGLAVHDARGVSRGPASPHFLRAGDDVVQLAQASRQVEVRVALRTAAVLLVEDRVLIHADALVALDVLRAAAFAGGLARRGAVDRRARHRRRVGCTRDRRLRLRVVAQAGCRHRVPRR